MKRDKYHSSWILASAVIIFGFLMSSCDLMSNSDDPDEFGSVSTILGRGYDVFDKYADPEFIKSPILDFEALRSAGVIERTSLENTRYDTLSGTTVSSYQEKMGLSADLEGSLRFFSGSFGGSFSSSTYEDSSNQYATIHVRVRKDLYAIKNRSNASGLREYLDSDFESYLNDPEYFVYDLFDNYGTHVMAGVIMGARYDYNLAAKKSSSHSGQTITAYAQASFASVFGSAASSSNYSKDQTTFDAFNRSESSVTGVGGNSALVASEDGLNNWIDSINRDTVVLADYAAVDGLIPIWELCSDSARAAAIEAAYTSWEQVKYEKYVRPAAPGTTGTLRFTLMDFTNFSFPFAGQAEWLWRVRLYSALDGRTRTLVSRLETRKEVGKGDTHSFNPPGGYYSTYWDVPLDEVHNFRIRPYLIERELNHNGIGYMQRVFSGDNDLYFDFNSTTSGTVIFEESGGGSNGWFTSTSGQTNANDSMTLQDGESKNFYLVMQEKNSPYIGKAQFKFKVEWNHND